MSESADWRTRLASAAYRVLLTRGRDGTLIFVPAIPELDATHERLVAAAVVSLA